MTKIKVVKKFKMLKLATTVIFVSIVYSVAGDGTRPPKQYVVNLDLPEEQRWTQVVMDHTEIIKDIHIFFKYVKVWY